MNLPPTHSPTHLNKSTIFLKNLLPFTELFLIDIALMQHEDLNAIPLLIGLLYFIVINGLSRKQNKNQTFSISQKNKFRFYIEGEDL